MIDEIKDLLAINAANKSWFPIGDVTQFAGAG